MHLLNIFFTLGLHEKLKTESGWFDGKLFLSPPQELRFPKDWAFPFTESWRRLRSLHYIKEHALSMQHPHFKSLWRLWLEKARKVNTNHDD